MHETDAGTDKEADPTAHLVIPTAINTMADQVPGGWPALTRQNHAMALAARAGLADLPVGSLLHQKDPG